MNAHIQPDLPQEVEQQLETWHTASLKLGARSTALTILEKIQPYHKKDITKEELIEILNDLEIFCRKFYDLEAVIDT